MKTRWGVVVALMLAVGTLTSLLLPAIAASESSPRITAFSGLYPYWAPATATVGENGAVTFANPSSSEKHGLEFTSAVKPSCSGAPAEATGAVSWTATCTFATPGTYSFICTVHPAYMQGTVTVTAAGATTTTTTGVSTTSTQPGLTPPSVAPSNGASPLTASSPLAGGASSALKLAAGQHGTNVRGSLAISTSGAGARLSLALLARRAALAHASAATAVEVGRSLHGPLSAGRVSFAVALDARARRALHLAHRLALTLRLVLTPVQGSAVTLTRAVVLHS